MRATPSAAEEGAAVQVNGWMGRGVSLSENWCPTPGATAWSPDVDHVGASSCWVPPHQPSSSSWGHPATLPEPQWPPNSWSNHPEDFGGFLHVSGIPGNDFQSHSQAQVADEVVSDMRNCVSELTRTKNEMQRERERMAVERQRQQRGQSQVAPQEEQTHSNSVRGFPMRLDPSTVDQNTGKMGNKSRDGTLVCTAWQKARGRGCAFPCTRKKFHGCAYLDHTGNLVVIINVIALPFTNTVLSSVLVLVLVLV